MYARRNSNAACILLNQLYLFYVSLCFIESKAVKYDLMNLEMVLPTIMEYAGEENKIFLQNKIASFWTKLL